MTQNTSDVPDDNKKEAVSFFSKWLTSENKGDGWDEVCLQWCKQNSAARKENVDPNCSMLCFNRPVNDKSINTNETWNPLKGYTVSVVNGRKECSAHTNEMADSSNFVDSNLSELETKYKLDLGDVWTQADTKAKQVINDKVVPLYNSTIEQAVALKDSSEAIKLQEYIKTTSSSLLSKIYPMAPFKIEEKSDNITSDDNK